jgi:hypothetical protein
MKDVFKRETMKGFDVWDIRHLKYFYNKHRSKDAHMVKRAARRKNKEKLRNYIDNEINV